MTGLGVLDDEGWQKVDIFRPSRDSLTLARLVYYECGNEQPVKPKKHIMPNDIAHFAIRADNCQRAKVFYETVFGWRFEPWGPPEFWRIQTSPGAVHGALQKRQHPEVGTGGGGYECTIAVENIGTITAAIEQAGGKILVKPVVIEGVGVLIQFEDTESNIACAMQYEKRARP